MPSLADVALALLIGAGIAITLSRECSTAILRHADGAVLDGAACCLEIMRFS